MMNWRSHIKEVIFTLLIALAIVLFWRGTWGLLDIYLFPNDYFLSYVISILAGILILYLNKNLLKKLA